MRKFSFLLLLVGSAILMYSWSFSGQSTAIINSKVARIAEEQPNKAEPIAPNVVAEPAKEEPKAPEPVVSTSTEQVDESAAIQAKLEARRAAQAELMAKSAVPILVPQADIEAARQAELKAMQAEQPADVTKTGQPGTPDEAAKVEEKKVDQPEMPSEKAKESIPVEPKLEGKSEAPEPAPSKWAPLYGEKGELLNPRPVISLKAAQEPSQPPVITTTLLYEDFEGSWGPWGDIPPSGWTIADSGTEGTKFWWTDDFMKFYATGTGWNDTVARSLHYSNAAETTFNEWLISPSFSTQTATTCSLYWKEYYYNGSNTRDSSFILVSTNNGASWTRLLSRAASSPNPNRPGLSLNAYTEYPNVKIAFNHWGKGSSPWYWWIDSVRVVINGNPIWVQDFNNWGTWGSNPPSGWTILDNGEYATPAAWNNNDWHKRTGMGGTNNVAAILQITTEGRREIQNEWLISPMFSIGTGVACTLSVAEYYYRSTSGHFPYNDTGYIKISETTDGGFTWGPWSVIYANVASKGSSTAKTVYKYSLNAYVGKTVRLAFHFVDSPDGGDTWYVDDVKVDDYVIHPYDVTSVAILSPPSIVVQGYPWAVATRVGNVGQNAATFQDTVKISRQVRSILLFEEFSNPQGWTGANPPVNPIGTWTILDSGSVAGTWNNNDWHAYYHSSWGDTIARVYYSPVEYQNEWLISPTINCTGRSNVHLTFKIYYDDYSGTSDTGWVLGTTNNWQTTQLIAMYVDADYGSLSTPATPDYDISSWAAGQANVKIAFKYKGYNALYCMYVDEVTVYESLPTVTEYSQGRTVTNLQPWQTTDVTTFPNWTPGYGDNYIVTTFTALAGDGNRANDTLTTTVTSYPHIGTGGPDAGYYTWKDNINGGGPAFSWIDISTPLAPLNFNLGSGDDRYTSGIDMGFSFFYYGNYYSRVFISEDGLVSFDSLTSSFSSNSTIPSTSAPNNMLAFFWDDLKQPSGGSAYYYTNNVDTFIVSFIGWSFYASSDSINRFDAQVIISKNDRRIKFQYQNMGPYATTSHTIGIEGPGGTTGLQYVYNGSPLGNIALPGLAITFDYTPPAHNIVTTSILAPIGSGLVGVPITPKAVFKNVALVNEPNVPVRMIITPGTYNSTRNVSIPAVTFDTVDFDNFIPPAPGNYYVTAIAELPSDLVRSDDTLRGTCAFYDTLIDFEANAGGLLGTGTWQWGVPTSGPGAAFSGTKCWATNLSGNYTAGTHYLSFKIQVGTANPKFGFTHWYYTERGYDGGNFQVSTNGGLTWEVVQGSKAYDTLGYSSNPLAGQPIFSGTTHQYWENVTFKLGAYAGQTIDARLAFGADGSGFYPGWYVDDFAFTDCRPIFPSHDVRTISILSPTAASVAGGNLNVSVRVANMAPTTETFPDSFRIDPVQLDTIFYERFSNPQGWTGANPPINPIGTWTVIDSGSLADGWNNNDWHAYYHSSWSDTVARVYYSPVETQNEWLISPAINCAGRSTVYLSFKHYYYDWSSDNSDTAYVFGTRDNWATAYLIARFTGTSYGSSTTPDKPIYDISSWAAGQSNIKIGFKYVGYNAWYWYVDDVIVAAPLNLPPVYAQRVTVNNLGPFEQRDINFPTWNNAPAGDYILTTFTNLGTDVNRSNDTVRSAITIYPHHGTGGPDAGYYVWNDNINGGGPAFAWKDISAIGTPINFDLGSGDDRYTSGINMGLASGFTFYGRSYNKIYISENGILSFDSLTSAYLTNYGLPSTSGPRNALALVWDDMYLKSDGQAYYWTNNVDSFIVSFINLAFYTSTDSMYRVSAQVILSSADKKIKFQYRDVGPYTQLSHTVGIQDSFRTTGLQYVYNGSPRGNVIFSNLAITFSYAPPTHDIKAHKFVAPSATGVVGVPFTPQVMFKNLGLNNEPTVPVRLLITPGTYNNTQSTSINMGDSATVPFANFTPPSGGTYQLTAIAELPTDVNRSNDTIRMTFSAYDAVLDFEASNGGLVATGSWGTMQGDWEWGVPTNVGPATAHSGTKCWATQIDTNRTNGYPYGGIYSWLSFNLNVGTGHNAVFGFWEWYKASGVTYDSLNVKINAGSGWVLLSTAYGVDTVWHYRSYDLSAYTGIVEMRLEYFSNSSIANPGWYVDDFTFTNCSLFFPSHDVKSNAILSPSFAINGYNWPVKTQVQNVGQNTESFQDTVKIIGIVKNIIFSEEFSNPQGWTGANPPINPAGTWAVVDSGSLADGWNNNDWHAYYHSTWGDTVARVYYSPIENQKEWLISPAINCTGRSNVYLSFNHYYYDYSSDNTDTGFVYGTNNNWATKYLIATFTGASYGTSSAPATPIYDISSWAAGQSNVKIGFKYVGNNDWYWYVDKVTLYELGSPTLVYSQGASVSNLISMEVRDVNFPNWNNPSAGDYQLTTYTCLGTDQNRANDTLRSYLTCYPHFGTGGPDDGYYVWKDNINGGGGAFSWIDISGVGTPIAWEYGSGDDRFTASRSLGFLFKFYERNYDRVYISENGILSFDTLTSSYLTNYNLPSTSAPRNALALLWDDLRQGSGTAYYYTNNTDTFIVSLVNFVFDADTTNSFDAQVILTGDNKIKFQYRTIGQGAILSHTIGIQDSFRTAGLQYVYNGNPRGNVAMPNLAITFSYARPLHDMAAISILTPGASILKNVPYTPQAVFENKGQSPENNVKVRFRVYNNIGTMIYNDSATIGAIASLAKDTVEFTPDTLTVAGAYTCTTLVQLPGDGNTANDKIGKSFTVEQHQAQGGPDAYNYRWIDNYDSVYPLILVNPPQFNWIELNPALGGSGIELVTQSADDASYSFPLGFTFTYYDSNYTSAWATTNGMIAFGTSTTSYSNTGIPNSSTPNAFVAPFWDDLHLCYSLGSRFFYKNFGTYTVVEWYNFRRHADTLNTSLTFQVILYNDGKILFQYYDVGSGDLCRGEDATVGIESPVLPDVNVIGLQYLYNGNPSLSLLIDSLAILFYREVPEHDVQVVAINSPTSPLTGGQTYNIIATFKNVGANTETFNVRAFDNRGYLNTQTISNLAPGQTRIDTFPGWSVVSCSSYTLTVVTQLGTDVNRSNDTLRAEYAVAPTYNNTLAYDNGAYRSAWRFYSPNNIIANKFAAPLASAQLIGVYYAFHTTWPDANRDTVELSLWFDQDADSLPDATPVLTKRMVPGANGTLVWNVACDSTIDISCNIPFWAGWRFVDTLKPEGIIIDSVTNFPSRKWARVDGVWQLYDPYPGDNHIRAYVNGLPGQNLVLGTHTINGQAVPGGMDTVTTTIGNDGNCVLTIFSVQTIQNLYVNRHQPRLTPISETPMVNDKGSWIEPTFPPQLARLGGPDAFGYYFIDSDTSAGPTYSWVDISGVGTPVNFTGDRDDGYTDPLPMGMTFQFYGNTFDSIVIGTDGWISFQRQYSPYYFNVDVPTASLPNNLIAVYWDDLDGSVGGNCYWYHDAANSRFIVSWVNWPHYGYPTHTVNFQVILNADGTIITQYGSGTWKTSYTIGIENSDGSIGLRVAYNQTYVHSNLAIKFKRNLPFLSTDLTAGNINPTQQFPFNVFLDATGLELGTYTGSIVITSNDPDEPTAVINVTFLVGSACSYIPGDLNGDDLVRGGDVTYGVRYFKGLGPQPPDSCYDARLPGNGYLYVAGDVNGNCEFRGSDVTRLVAYFKGVASLSYCPYFPPPVLREPSPIKIEPQIQMIPRDEDKTIIRGIRIKE